MSEQQLYEFVRESNRIEGIVREPTEAEIKAHEWFLALRPDELTVGALEEFVGQVAGELIRERPGMDVRVGNHYPPPGSPDIPIALDKLLRRILNLRVTPYEAHGTYEQLHPFMDGNGRSGRALWAWQMLREDLNPFLLPFLHRFYYQALDASR